jgi:HEPN domain-containing protein
MKNKNLLLAKKWIEKADKDLEIAGLLLKRQKRFLDSVCFHIQQAFEKYLKSILVCNGVFPDKTHDLEKLLNQTLKYNMSLMKWIDVAREITPFAVFPRYPDEVFDVPLITIRKLAKKVKVFQLFVKDFIKDYK